MAKYTVAVIGCGRISETHFKGLANIEGCYVKYACDLIESKAAAYKEQYPELIGEVITDYKVALADPEVEAVFIFTPNYAHYTITMDALRAGKHVLCEKPVTVNYALSKEMADEAEKQGKILNIGVCNRYRLGIEKLEEMVREGKLGRVYHVVCDFRAFRSIPGLGGDFTTKSASGGGVLIDWGVHYLDLILYILGGAKLRTVSCDTYCEMAKDMRSYKYTDMWAEDTADIENGTNDVDDFVAAHIRTDKANITVTGAWAQNVSNRGCFVDFLGDKGGVRLDYGSGNFTFTSADTLETEQVEFPEHHMYGREDEAFLISTKTGVRDKNHISGILETMRLLDTMYRSAEEEREIKLG